MKFRIYNPEIFQGNMKKKNYFEGWYFKHVSKDLNHVWSFIPGISLTEKDPHTFIQVINGITGESVYITYPVDNFTYSKEELNLRIGNSDFTDKYISLDIDHNNLKIKGELIYSNTTPYPGNVFSPGIMGWYSFIPFMECKHGIVSVNHNIEGRIVINETITDFDGGKGYIEKDWGTSFPETWIWIQGNNFSDAGTSFQFSVAKIPWLGKFFIGFIAFLYSNKQFYLFSTYNKSVISEISHSENSLDISIKNKDFSLQISAIKSVFGELMAPVSGNMTRRIKESIDSEVSLRLIDKNNNLIYSDSTKRAGLEIIETIFDYLKAK
jgi:tocopherol cyclase